MCMIEALVGLLFTETSLGVACSVMFAVSSLVWLVARAWHGHEHNLVVACDSIQGRIGQIFNGNATINCGLSSVLSKVSFLLELAGLVAAVGFAVALIVLVTKGEFATRLEL